MKIKVMLSIFMIFCLLQIISCSEKKKSYSSKDEIVSIINKEDIKRFSELLKNYDINARSEKGRTFLMETAFYKSIDIAKLLIKKGANINIQDNTGNTALVIALEKGRDEITKLLLENGANIKLKPKEKSIFLLACKDGDLTNMKLLVKKGINIQERSEDRKTGLMVALNNNRKINFLEYLIKIGIDINAKDNNGDTALMMCTYSDTTMDYLDFLIKIGADVNIVNNENMTALDNALKYENKNTEYNNDYIIEILKKAGAKRASEL